MLEVPAFLPTPQEMRKLCRDIKVLLTDVDGVLTDTGVYYSSFGEEMKRFSIRDGMGVQLLREQCGIETIIITGENSEIVSRRAEKLQINKVYLGCKDKKTVVQEIMNANRLKKHHIAAIGDDVNDLEMLLSAEISACPADAVPLIQQKAQYICIARGGFGAFREFADLIISQKISEGS